MNDAAGADVDPLRIANSNPHADGHRIFRDLARTRRLGIVGSDDRVVIRPGWRLDRHLRSGLNYRFRTLRGNQLSHPPQLRLAHRSDVTLLFLPAHDEHKRRKTLNPVLLRKRLFAVVVDLPDRIALLPESVDDRHHLLARRAPRGREVEDDSVRLAPQSRGDQHGDAG